MGKSAEATRTLVYFHGGAFVLCRARTERMIVGNLVAWSCSSDSPKAIGGVVVLVGIFTDEEMGIVYPKT